MKFGIIVVFEKTFDTYFFLSAIVHIEGVWTTLKVEKFILLNISEIIKDTLFVQIDKTNIFLTTSLMVYTILRKKLEKFVQTVYIKNTILFYSFSE